MLTKIWGLFLSNKATASEVIMVWDQLGTVIVREFLPKEKTKEQIRKTKKELIDAADGVESKAWMNKIMGTG